MLETCTAKSWGTTACRRNWQRRKSPPARIVEELYLAAYSRRPTEEELRIGTALYENPETNRRGATEDLLWGVLNTPEFVFKD